MMDRQRAAVPCHCGRRATVRPTASPYEFTVTCPCGRDGIISWAHAHPPPTYEAPAQPQLFDEGRD